MIAANLNSFLQSLIAKVVFRADTMKLMENAPGITSIMFGTLFSVFTGMVYIYMLHEPGSSSTCCTGILWGVFLTVTNVNQKF
jgi:hypothetical protein